MSLPGRPSAHPGGALTIVETYLLLVTTHEGTEHELTFVSQEQMRRAQIRLVTLDLARRVSWSHGPNMYLIQEEP